MAKKHAKHEEKKGEVKKAKGVQLFKQIPVLTALFIVLSCLFGILIGVVAVLSFYPQQVQPEQAQPGEAPAIMPSGSPEGMACLAPISPDDVKKKVKYFIDESFLKSRSMELKINNVESYNEYLYYIDAEVSSEKGSMPAGPIYATKDGEKIIIGPLYDLNEPLKFEQPTPEPVEYPKSDKPEVLMFVMSFCPFGQQAEKGLKPAIELLGDTIEFEPHYVIYSNYGSGYPDYCLDENVKYCSMHGIAELREDVRQLCIWKYEPDKFWPYVEKIYQGNCNLNNIDTCWKEQAQALGIDTAKIEECFNNEAFALLEEEVKLNKKYNVRGSPTILINETEYSGDRSPQSFKDAICSAFNEQPEECSQELSGESGGASGQC